MVPCDTSYLTLCFLVCCNCADGLLSRFTCRHASAAYDLFFMMGLDMISLRQNAEQWAMLVEWSAICSHMSTVARVLSTPR